MTRTLPWIDKRRAATSQQLAPAETSRTKRRRTQRPIEDEDSDASDSRSRTGGSSVARAESTSPLPRPPSESFMEEGLDKDDRYRMVEDEFLDVAKQFTQHLHAAEYKRMRKAAKSENVATISSISRPVTTKMSSDTRRKIECVKRSKKQAKELRRLMGEQLSESGSGGDSDNAGDPWIETSLRHLMKSPRRPADPLSKISKTIRTTRAAAGFREPRHPTIFQIPQPYSHTKRRRSLVKCPSPLSDNDDDLDAPVRSLNLPSSSLAIPLEMQPPAQQANLVDSSIKEYPQSTMSVDSVQSFSAENQLRIERSRLSRPQRITKELPKREPDTIIPTFL